MRQKRRTASSIRHATLLVLALFQSPTSFANEVMLGWENVQFPIFAKPIFQGERAAPPLESKDLRFMLRRRTSEGDETILEQVSAQRAVYRFIRGGIYYGEYLERESTPGGQFVKDINVNLLGSNPSPIKPLQLRFKCQESEYVYQGNEIIRIHQRNRDCRYSADGKIQAHSGWRRSDFDQVYASVQVFDRRKKGSALPLYVTTRHPESRELIHDGRMPCDKQSAKALFRYRAQNPPEKQFVELVVEESESDGKYRVIKSVKIARQDLKKPIHVELTD